MNLLFNHIYLHLQVHHFKIALKISALVAQIKVRLKSVLFLIAVSICFLNSLTRTGCYGGHVQGLIFIVTRTTFVVVCCFLENCCNFEESII